jgi:hypothetical protein
MGKKALIYLKKQTGQIEGPFTVKMLAKVFASSNDYVEWLWYESVGTWSPIEQHQIEVLFPETSKKMSLDSASEKPPSHAQPNSTVNKVHKEAKGHSQSLKVPSATATKTKTPAKVVRSAVAKEEATEPTFAARFQTLQGLKVLGQYKTKLFDGKLDQASEKGCNLFDLSEHLGDPEALLGSKLKLNLLDLETGTSENVTVKIVKVLDTQHGPKVRSFEVEWEKLPSVIAAILAQPAKAS